MRVLGASGPPSTAWEELPELETLVRRVRLCWLGCLNPRRHGTLALQPGSTKSGAPSGSDVALLALVFGQPSGKSILFGSSFCPNASERGPPRSGEEPVKQTLTGP